MIWPEVPVQFADCADLEQQLKQRIRRGLEKADDAGWIVDNAPYVADFLYAALADLAPAREQFLLKENERSLERAREAEAKAQEARWDAEVHRAACHEAKRLLEAAEEEVAALAKQLRLSF